MDIRFSMEVAQRFTRDEKGLRTATATGIFQTSQRIDKALWLKMKEAGARFISDEDAEDGIGIAGWNYPLRSLIVVLKAGNAVKVDGIECKTIKELFDACENIPRQEQERAEALRKRSELIQAIKNDVLSHGTRPQSATFPTGHVVDLGGSCFVINGNEVWLIEWNSADGDDWSKNNIPGAIAHRILDAGLAGQLQGLKTA